MPDELADTAAYLDGLRGGWALLHCAGPTRTSLADCRPFNRDKARDMLQAGSLCDAGTVLRGLRLATGIRWRAGVRPRCRRYVDARWLAPQAFARV